LDKISSPFPFLKVPAIRENESLFWQENQPDENITFSGLNFSKSIFYTSLQALSPNQLLLLTGITSTVITLYEKK